MDGSVRAARKAAVALIATASVFVGLLLIWYFVRPGVIAQVTTPHMLVVLGLFLMPVVTLAAWEMERRVRASSPADTQPAPAPELPGPDDGTPAERPAEPPVGARAAHLPVHDEPVAHAPGQSRQEREAGHRRGIPRQVRGTSATV